MLPTQGHGFDSWLAKEDPTCFVSEPNKSKKQNETTDSGLFNGGITYLRRKLWDEHVWGEKKSKCISGLSIFVTFIIITITVMGHTFYSIQFSPQLMARSLGLIAIDVSFMNKGNQFLKSNHWFCDCKKRRFTTFWIYMYVSCSVIY